MLFLSGIGVSYSNIWPIWLWCYYISPPALLSRSLILSTITDSLYKDIMESSDLHLMSPSLMIIVLILWIIVGRFLSIALFYYKEHRGNKLTYSEEEWVTVRLQSLFSQNKQQTIAL